MNKTPIQGAGLGLRRALLNPLAKENPLSIGFYEVAPENWMRVGGKLGRQFRAVTESRPLIGHGLCLSLGGPAPLDAAFLRELKAFLRNHQIHAYSEHLSYCGDDGHLYDLMPIPFTGEAVSYVAERIRRTQDILEQRIAIENIAYYAAPGKAMEELDFLLAVLAEADCDFLLDVNNLYVNSVNQGYDAEAFIAALPGGRIVSLHIAGHHAESEDFLIDTHGAPVIDPVWRLLDRVYERFGVLPTLLERDFNLPPLSELLTEIDAILRLQMAHAPPLRPHD
jgi:hypothetical protein